MVAAFVAILASLSLASTASAVDVVQEGRTIEAFIGTNLVDLQNYPANRSVDLEVVRNGVVVGSVSASTDDTGFLEINHVGGGQFPEGDCFKPPATPDIMAGDVVRTRTEGDAAGVVDSAVVRDLGINFATISVDTSANTITVSGHARSREDAVIVPGTDVLELRLNKATATNRWETGPGLDQDRPNRRDLRVDIGGDLDANGNFTRVLRVSNDDAVDWQNNPGEVMLEWSVGGAGEEEVNPPAIFVADEGEGGIPDCPPLALYAMTNSSHKFVNVATVGRDMVLSGVSFNADDVKVWVPGSTRHSATLTPVNAAAPDEHQTWRATVPAAELAALPQGMFTVRAQFVGPGAPTEISALRILKDTIAPAKPTATPPAGTYSRPQAVTLSAERGAKIYYTVDGSRPTRDSQLFVRQIRVTATQTIKAIAVDGANNRSLGAGFRYRIL